MLWLLVQSIGEQHARRPRRSATVVIPMAFAAPLRLKLRPPALREGHVPRPVLTQRITALGAGGWALLSAPAGYGKSTLASELVHAADSQAWITVDELDDLPRFAIHVLAACDPLGDRIGAETRLALDGAASEQALGDALLGDLLELERELVLVVDDLHASRDPAVERVVLELAAHAPAGLRLIVASRSEPTRALHRMRASGSLLELRSDDLAFDASSIERLVAVRTGKTPSSTEVERIREATRGWPLAVQLVATSLSRGVGLPRCLERLAGHADLIGVLAAEVLDTFDPLLRRRVLTLAPLEVLTAPLCEAVMPGVDGAAVLRELDQLNAFASSTNEARSILIAHPLWTAFLRERAVAELGADVVARTLRCASVHCERDGELARAIGYAFAGDDLERAATLLETSAFALLEQGAGLPVLRWLDALGDRGHTPALLAARGWAELLALRWKDAAQSAAALRASGVTEAAIIGHAAAIDAVLAFAAGDAAKGEVLAAEALAKLSPSDPARAAVHSDRGIARARAGDTNGARDDLAEASARGSSTIARGAAWYLAEMDLAAGDLVAARLAHQRATERDPDRGHPSLAALAELAREAGELEDASRRIDAFLDDARTRGNTHALAVGLIGRARIVASVGRFDIAREHLSEAGELVERTRLQPWTAGVRALRGLVELRAFVADDVDATLAACQTVFGSSTTASVELQALLDVSNLPPEIIGLVAARIELLAGAPGPGVRALASWRARAHAQGRVRSLLELDIVSALARAATGERGASADFEAAGARAAAAGFERLASDDAPFFAWLLAAGARVDASAVDRSNVLSRRELEVLGLIATGLSTADAARRLHVSHATVKKHLENVYARLEVHSRMQAVAVARSRGLLR